MSESPDGKLEGAPQAEDAGGTRASNFSQQPEQPEDPEAPEASAAEEGEAVLEGTVGELDDLGLQLEALTELGVDFGQEGFEADWESF